MVKASFDVTTKEGKLKVFNAKNGSSVSMKELEDGDTLTCVGVMQYEDEVTSYGQQGEQTITVLFLKDGGSYASISPTIAKTGDALIDLVADLELDVFDIRLTKHQSSKGQTFLNIELVV